MQLQREVSASGQLYLFIHTDDPYSLSHTVGYARNEAIKQSSGKYLCIFDAVWGERVGGREREGGREGEREEEEEEVE